MTKPGADPAAPLLMKNVGENVVRIEAAALRALADRLAGQMGESFDRAIDLLYCCAGRVVVTGMGKSGLIARKIAATLTSTGSPALFLHPAEAMHGDLGMVVRGDVVLALSASGETSEILQLLATVKRLGVPLITMTCDELYSAQDNRRMLSTLAQAADIALDCSVANGSRIYIRGAKREIHQGAVYWVVGTRSFDKTGRFTLTSQGYVTAKHEDLEFPSMAAAPTPGGRAIMDFTLNGNGGPTGADHGGFFPRCAYGRLTSTSGGLLKSTINVANLGKSPQDGFTEYQGFPGPTRPRWGDYSWALFVPGTGRIYFANEYIQFPNCTGSAFSPTAIYKRRDQGRDGQLGDVGQLRHPITQSAPSNGRRTSQTTARCGIPRTAPG